MVVVKKSDKRLIYILSFILLGVLLSFLIHALVEMWYIRLLVSDFDKYGLGLSWSDWYLIHHIATVLLFILGILFGFCQGKFWWKRIYEDNIRSFKSKDL